VPAESRHPDAIAEKEQKKEKLAGVYPLNSDCQFGAALKPRRRLSQGQQHVSAGRHMAAARSMQQRKSCGQSWVRRFIASPKSVYPRGRSWSLAFDDAGASRVEIPRPTRKRAAMAIKAGVGGGVQYKNLVLCRSGNAASAIARRWQRNAKRPACLISKS